MGKVKEYLADHQNAWAPSTLKSESSKLNKYGHLVDQDPAKAFKSLTKDLKPYTIKTLFIRLSHYKQWQVDKGLDETNTYKEFLRKHANKFKHVYDRKPVKVDYNTTLSRIRSLSDQDVRETAEFLLKSGLRISEAYKVKDGFVVGKGSKKRPVFVDPPQTLASQKRLRDGLSSIELTPHDLRKLCATRLVEKGADAATLCHVMGWTKIETAYRYIQPKNNESIKEMMEN